MTRIGNAIAPALTVTPDELKKRTKKFALDIIRFTGGLPRGIAMENERKRKNRELEIEN